MGDTSYTQLIPFSELAPGQAGVIRNAIINTLVAEASARTRLPPGELVVRDIRAKEDLVIYSEGRMPMLRIGDV